MFSSRENSFASIEMQLSVIANSRIEILLRRLFQEGCNREEFDQMIDIYEQEGYDFFDFLAEKDANGNTPIHIAAQFGHVIPIVLSLHHIIVNLMFESGERRGLWVVNNQNNEGKTPLHLAIEERNLMCVAALVDRYRSNIVDVNIRDNKGQTPLHVAVLSKNYEAIKALLSVQHIDIKIEDNNGKSVHDYVESSMDKKIINLFINHYNSKIKKVACKLEKADRAAKSSSSISKTCNYVTVGFSAVGGLIALICAGIYYADSDAHKCECNTAVYKYKTVGIVFASVASVLCPFTLFLHNRSSSYKEKHNLLSNDIEKYKMQTSELVKVVRNLCREDSINEKTLSNIITQLQKSGYIRQVRSAEVSIRIQENDSIQRTASCGAQMCPKGKSNEELPYTVLQSSNLSINVVSCGRLQE